MKPKGQSRKVNQEIKKGQPRNVNPKRSIKNGQS